MTKLVFNSSYMCIMENPTSLSRDFVLFFFIVSQFCYPRLKLAFERYWTKGVEGHGYWNNRIILDCLCFWRSHNTFFFYDFDVATKERNIVGGESEGKSTKDSRTKTPTAFHSQSFQGPTSGSLFGNVTNYIDFTSLQLSGAILHRTNLLSIDLIILLRLRVSIFLTLYPRRLCIISPHKLRGGYFLRLLTLCPCSCLSSRLYKMFSPIFE